MSGMIPAARCRSDDYHIFGDDGNSIAGMEHHVVIHQCKLMPKGSLACLALFLTYDDLILTVYFF